MERSRWGPVRQHAVGAVPTPYTEVSVNITPSISRVYYNKPFNVVAITEPQRANLSEQHTQYSTAKPPTESFAQLHTGMHIWLRLLAAANAVPKGNAIRCNLRCKLTAKNPSCG